MIYPQQDKKMVSFGIHTAAWLCLSKSINLGSAAGLKGFVESMARIYPCEDRWAAGFDLSCNNRMCYLNGLGTYSFQKEPLSSDVRFW